MRFIVFGAGAVGGTVAARFAQHGHDVVAVARGPHAAAIRVDGLRLETPTGAHNVPIPVATSIADAAIEPGDIVLLGVKSQDTVDALDSLRAAAPLSTPVVCVQNGVDNERTAARRFEHVYGVCVLCPTTHLAPGVVQAHSTPVTGVMDVGRFPGGVDGVTESVAAAFNASTFDSIAQSDIMRWKYRKLIMNLLNAVEAICGPDAARSPLARIVRDEGEACLRAAGIAAASVEEDHERRDGRITPRPIGGAPRGGGSSWQSLQRGAGSIETDYLNGEIVLLGRQHRVPTPANAVLQQLAAEMAASRLPPASMTVDDVLARLGG